MSLTATLESMLSLSKELDGYLETNAISYPTVNNDTLSKLPPELQNKRSALTNAINDFWKVVRGPEQSAMDLIFSVSWLITLVLYTIHVS
jgi:hypothetical protein